MPENGAVKHALVRYVLAPEDRDAHQRHAPGYMYVTGACRRAEMAHFLSSNDRTIESEIMDVTERAIIVSASA